MKITAPIATGPAASLEAVTIHAAALKSADRAAEALPFNKRATELAPERPTVWHNYAATLGDLGYYEDALEAGAESFRRGGDAPETWLVRGRALLGLGRFEEAAADFRQALKRRPAYVDAHRDLAQLIWMQTEDVRAATRMIDQALAAQPQQGALRLTRAKVLSYAGRHDEAYRSAAEAARQAPDDLTALLAAAFHARNAGEETAAAALVARAYRIAPAARPVIEAWCTTCLGDGRPELAFEAARRGLADAPFDQHLLAFLAVSARLLGRPEYAQLYDYETFVRPARIEPPQGWPDLDQYLGELKNALVGLHRLRAHPFDQSLRHGSQTTRNLLLSDEPPVKAFFQAIDEPIRRYMDAIGRGADPLRARNTGRHQIRGAWSVRLRPEGHHVNHVHPEGWLSSAFYVETPAAALDRGDREGWIKFGQPDIVTRPPIDPGFHVRPEPGTLVLFPSYMFHGTVPFSTAENRLTIAFDVIPA